MARIFAYQIGAPSGVRFDFCHRLAKIAKSGHFYGIYSHIDGQQLRANVHHVLLLALLFYSVVWEKTKELNYSSHLSGEDKQQKNKKTRYAVLNFNAAIISSGGERAYE